MTALKPNKGYIFSATHNIQEDVPLGNVLAMCRAGHLTNLQSFVLFPC
jgi:uroporphyrinogen-III decarboxylase